MLRAWLVNKQVYYMDDCDFIVLNGEIPKLKIYLSNYIYMRRGKLDGSAPPHVMNHSAPCIIPCVPIPPHAPPKYFYNPTPN